MCVQLSSSSLVEHPFCPEVTGLCCPWLAYAHRMTFKVELEGTSRGLPMRRKNVVVDFVCPDPMVQTCHAMTTAPWVWQGSCTMSSLMEGLDGLASKAYGEVPNGSYFWASESVKNGRFLPGSARVGCLNTSPSAWLSPTSHLGVAPKMLKIHNNVTTVST